MPAPGPHRGTRRERPPRSGQGSPRGLAHRGDPEVLRRAAREAERAAFDALRAQYGLQIPGLSPRAVAAMLEALDAGRYRTLDERGLVPCRARLQDGTVVEPCLIWLSEWGAAEFLDGPRKLVGGQVARLLPSAHALPVEIAEAARRTREYRPGAYVPLLVSIEGRPRYLVPAHASFFRCGGYTGKDVDPDFAAEPSEREHRLGRYVWGDDLREKITLIALEWPGQISE